YLSQKRLDEAKKQFETLVARQQDPVASGTMLGIILEIQGRPADAQKMYERTLEVDPTAPVAANNLAWMYATHGGNLDVALQLAQTAKQKLADDASVDDTLGWIFYKKDLAVDAIRSFEASVKRMPTKAEYHFHLGLAHAK